MKTDLEYLKEAIRQSRRCVPICSAYCVGAVVVLPSGRSYTGYTHETGSANHAEEEAIAKALAAGEDLRGATMYSSMEPCSLRKSKPESCTELILRYGFSKVVFALKEPPCFVECHGEELLRKAGVDVVVLPGEAAEVREINRHICG